MYEEQHFQNDGKPVFQKLKQISETE